MGVGETFRPTPVGVFFGGPGETPADDVADPYFGGEGPDRNPCRNCGECMTGCRHNAKNTLVKNYLHLAEKNGATVLPLTTVTRVSPRDGGGYDVHVRRTKAKLRRRHVVARADRRPGRVRGLGARHPAAAAPDEGRGPPAAALRPARRSWRGPTPSRSSAPSRRDASVDYTQGVAITSSFHPDEHTHIEPVRYGKGSNAMSLLQTVLTDGRRRPAAVAHLAARDVERAAPRARAVRRPALVRAHRHRPGHAEPRQLDHDVPQAQPRSAGWVLTSKQGHGEPNPTWIPAGNEAARRMADVMGGTAGGTIGEPFNRPMTAHFIGGCTIGASAESGVIDPYQRVYGHPACTSPTARPSRANLGVNPSLSITAQAERAMSFWPNRGEADPRPPLGRRYERIAPVAPASPAVPPTARRPCGCRSSRSPEDSPGSP